MLTGVIGPGCSSSSIALAPFTNRSEIGLVTLHLTGTPILADRVIHAEHTRIIRKLCKRIPLCFRKVKLEKGDNSL